MQPSLRRSSRAAQKASTSNSNPVSEPADSELGIDADADGDTTAGQEEENDKPQKKKRKPNTSKTTTGQQPLKKFRGNRGKLQQLIEMPMDILFEIFGALEPHDLLNLTRTSKALRAILMSRSSLSVWKHARSNIPGLPDCPEDISEPHYARLLFEATTCHDCGKVCKAPCAIAWDVRARFCSSCIPEHFRQDSYRLQNWMVPLETVESYGRRSQHRRAVKWYHRKTAEILCTENEALDGEPEEKWLSERKTICAAIIKHGKLCEAWLEEKDARRMQSLEDIKLKRIEEITEKLKQAGWEDELNYAEQYDRLCSHALVAMKKALTDRAWRTKIQPALEQFMHLIKSGRLERLEITKLESRQPLIKKVRETYIAACPINAIIPPAADIYLYEPFRTVVETTPAEEEFTIDRFEHAVTLLPEFIEQWRKEKEAELLKMMPEELFKARGSESFDLATAIFSCGTCNSRFPYLRALAHHHPDGYYDVPSDLGPEKKKLFENLREGTWNYKGRIKFDLSAHARAKELVKLCGLDPNSTTYQEMNEANRIFECTNCCSDESGRLVMGWETTVRHKCSYKNSEYVPPVVLIKDEKDEKFARELIEQERRRADANKERFCCAYCRTVWSVKQLKSHIRANHGEGKVRREDIIALLDKDHYVDGMRMMMDEWDE